MSSPVSPYPDSLPPLFRIGARPLDPADILLVDDDLTIQLAEKQRLGSERFGEVFMAEPDTEQAQIEVRDLIRGLLQRYHAATHRCEGDTIHVAGQSVDLGDPQTPALWMAARLVQEDLIIMRRGEDAWRLAAGALCFPSSWRLADKIGRPLHTVHAPVPGFGEGTRNDQIITRMFDALRPGEPMLRGNWSIYPDAELYHPEAGNPGPRFSSGETAFLRMERQTLSKLPQSGDILFTVRITIDPLPGLPRAPDRRATAGELVAHLKSLDADQLSYKGITEDRENLLSKLRTITGEPA